MDGIAQEPMDGTSFFYTLDDPAAAEQHTVQYFEMYGSRAIYKDGWWACAKLDKLPWDFSPATLKKFGPGGSWTPEQDTWELYYLPDDFSQARDLAADKPEKLAELKELFWQEAERNRVLPLLAGFAVFFGMLPPMATKTRFEFAGDVQNIQTTMIPRIYGRSYAIEAEVHVPESGAEGVLCAFADFIGGFALWVDENGLLNHTYQFLGVDTYKQTSTEPIPAGDVTLKMLFEADEPKPGSGGKVTLWAGQQADRRGQAGQDDLAALHHLRRHGYRPRQRWGRRPGLRRPGALRLHGHREEGGLRPEAHPPRVREPARAPRRPAVGAGAAG